MLETGIPKSLWRGDKMKEKLVGQFDKEKDKFMNKPDTNFQPSLDQRLPETKRFAYANKVSDFGLDDMISDKKFRFENVNNSILLGEQLPDDRPFKFSSGIKGINDHFDSMAPNKDYRYTDPQFYEYKLKDMTQQKIVETNWRVQGDSITNPDDLDGYARAIAYAQEYRRNKEAKSSPPSVQERSSESVQRSSPDTNMINVAPGGGGNQKTTSLRGGKEISIPVLKFNNDSAEKIGSPSIEIQPPKRTLKDVVQTVIDRKATARKNVKFLVEKLKVMGENALQRKRTNTARNQSIGLQKASKLVNDHQQLRSGFQQLKQQTQKHKEKSESVQKETVPTQKETVQTIPPSDNYEVLKTNLDSFYTKYADHFQYEQDKKNPSEFIVSNGKDKVGTEMAKYMRDELHVAGITAASNLEKANAELLKLEDSIKRIKQSPRMGRRPGGGTKASSKDDLELHFEQKTPANSKNSDATRSARAVSKGSDERRMIKPGGTNFKKSQEI